MVKFGRNSGIAISRASRYLAVSIKGESREDLQGDRTIYAKVTEVWKSLA